MQHLAESCRNRNPDHIGTGDRRATSYGSASDSHNAEDDLDTAPSAYESIEAEIDQLKEDVWKLRNEADKGRTEPKTEEELALDKYLSTRSTQNQQRTIDRCEESAAMRLQRLHEANQSENTPPVKQQLDAPVPPSPLDFPVLGQPIASPRVASSTTLDGPVRKTSYAHAATSNMIDALNHISSTGKKRSDSKFSDSTSNDPASVQSLTATTTTSRVQRNSTTATQHSQEADNENHSVLVVSEDISADSLHIEAAVYSKDKPSTPNSKTVKDSPRFAMPTESFARRAGETFRKDSASMSPKSPAEGSPTKSTKAKEPSLATAKRVSHQQKRSSLPGDWLKSAGYQRDQPVGEATMKTAAAASGTTLSPVNKSSPVSADSKQAAVGHRVKENAVPVKSKNKDTQSQAPLRKKTSSYMAPTTAATQRTIATRRPEKTKRKKRGQAKAEGSQVDVTHSKQQVSLPPRPSTAFSDNSSVQFILDRPSKDVVASPSPVSDTRRVNKKARRQNQAQSGYPAAKALAAGTVLLRSPSKIPTSSPHVARQSRRQIARNHSRSSDSLTSLPEVANTTTKRRTSHGHLLTPIVARLDAYGLLNKSSPQNATVEAYLQNTASNVPGKEVRVAREKLPEIQPLPFQISSGIAHSLHSGASPRKVVPPHLRKSREASTASTSTDATLCQAQATGMSSVDQIGNLSGIQLPQHGSISVAGSSNIGQNMISVVKSATAPSLRPTAEVFKPTRPLTEETILDDLPGALEFVPEDEWARMPADIKKMIQKKREQERVRKWLALNGVPAQRVSSDVPPKHDGISAISFVDDKGSPHAVQAGQVLHPILQPGQKHVQWMLQGVDGKDTPVKFGRAPAPSVAPIYEPMTPTISSASDDTSPLKTPLSLRGWQIGSASSPNPYGWTGGDGKEIRFVGYGPYAERDPNSVVNFNFQGLSSSFGAGVSNGYGEDKENMQSTEFVAPKSQRQWAEKVGYHKVPCGNVEITHALEDYPFGRQSAGYCHGCVAR